MLIEPTETESVETLDAFADALVEIVAEAERDPDMVVPRSTHRARQATGRGDRGTPAEPALATHGWRRDAVPGLSVDGTLRQVDGYSLPVNDMRHLEARGSSS